MTNATTNETKAATLMTRTTMRNGVWVNEYFIRNADRTVDFYDAAGRYMRTENAR